MDDRQRWIKVDELSLGEYTMKVLAQHGKDSEEFKDLVLVFGIDKLRNAYRAELEKRKPRVLDQKSAAAGDFDP